MFGAIATGLRPAGWLLLFAGVVLLAFKQLKKVLADAETRINPPVPKAVWSAP